MNEESGETILVPWNVSEVYIQFRYGESQGLQTTYLVICNAQINSHSLQYWQLVRIAFLFFRSIQVKQDRQVVLCIQRQLVPAFS